MASELPIFCHAAPYPLYYATSRAVFVEVVFSAYLNETSTPDEPGKVNGYISGFIGYPPFGFQQSLRYHLVGLTDKLLNPFGLR